MTAAPPPLRAAVVGYGQAASIHTRVLREEGHRLDWLVGRVPERTAEFARRHGFARHTVDLDEALADPALEAVIVASPNAMHAPQAAACLAAGKHALVEIPLAMSYPEGVRLAETARHRGLALAVSHGHRLKGEMRRTREMVASGQLSPHSIVARYLMLRHSNVGSTGYVRSWTDDLLWHHGQHAVDMTLWLLGVDRPGQVEVTSLAALPDRELGIPLDITVALRTRQDQVATISMSYNSRISVYDYLVIGREETLLLDGGALRTRDSTLYDPARDTADTDSWVLLIRDFAAAVREGRPPIISADSVLPALEVLQRADSDHAARAALDATHPVVR